MSSVWRRTSPWPIHILDRRLVADKGMHLPVKLKDLGHHSVRLNSTADCRAVVEADDIEASHTAEWRD
jgi:hypothetical protein